MSFVWTTNWVIFLVHKRFFPNIKQVYNVSTFTLPRPWPAKRKLLLVCLHMIRLKIMGFHNSNALASSIALFSWTFIMSSWASSNSSFPMNAWTLSRHALSLGLSLNTSRPENTGCKSERNDATRWKVKDPILQATWDTTEVRLK